MIKISTIAYDKLYKLLTAKIFNEELTQSQRDKQEVIDYSIWNISDIGNNGYNFFDKIFKNVRVARDHFWRKEKSYKPDIIKEVPFKEEVIIPIFEYLGVRIPDEVPMRERNTERKQFELLYDEFLKVHRLEKEDSNQDYFEMKRRELGLDASNKLMTDMLTIQQVKDFETIKREGIIADETVNYSSLVASTVNDFYNYIRLFGSGDKDKINGAFNYLDDFLKQNIFQGRVEFFVRGYLWTLSILRLHIFDVKVYYSAAEKRNVANLKVYLEEEVDIMRAFKALKFAEMDEKAIEFIYDHTQNFQSYGCIPNKIMPKSEQKTRLMNCWNTASLNWDEKIDVSRTTLPATFYRNFDIYMSQTKSGDWKISWLRIQAKF